MSDANCVEYYERGSGPAVALLHGGSCGADDWDNIVPRLAAKYRLVMPDGLRIPLDAWRVWRLLGALSVETVALVGHSAGGMLAREMYRLQPRRVWGLVNIDSQGTGGVILARNLPDGMRSPECAALYDQNREGMEQLRPQHRGDYPSAVTIDRRLLAYRRQAMTPAQRAATRTWPAPLAMTLPDAPAPEPISDAGKFIACPVMVVHTGRGKIGAEDITPEWIAANIQAEDVEYAMLKESGHWPWLEQSEWFLGRLEPFLARAAAKERAHA